VRSIEVSEAVWQAIAERGRFGETEDDVLRRVFSIPVQEGTVTLRPDSRGANNSRPRRSMAKRRLSSYIDDGSLVLSFQAGSSRSWKLPAKSDKGAIRATRSEAVEFAKAQDATHGQINAVKKTLTDAGYYLTR
jgi:negative regulator of replication initiation